jgi:hypothetical protein
MSHVDVRQSARDSLSLLATLKVEGDSLAVEYRVRVRNLSPAGLMAEGDVSVAPGSLVAVELKDIGWVEGSVAWKQDNRFGIAFAEDVNYAHLRR